MNTITNSYIRRMHGKWQVEYLGAFYIASNVCVANAFIIDNVIVGVVEKADIIKHTNSDDIYSIPSVGSTRTTGQRLRIRDGRIVDYNTDNKKAMIIDRLLLRNGGSLYGVGVKFEEQRDMFEGVNFYATA